MTESFDGIGVTEMDSNAHGKFSEQMNSTKQCKLNLIFKMVS